MKNFEEQNDFEKSICTKENLKIMLDYIKNYDSYDEWLVIGGGLKSCWERGWLKEEECLSLWVNWSSKSSKWDETNLEKWNKFSGKGNGIGQIYQKFLKGGGRKEMIEMKFNNNNYKKSLKHQKFKEINFVLDKEKYEKTLKNYLDRKSLTKEDTNVFETFDREMGMIFWNDDDNFRVFKSNDDKYDTNGVSMTKKEILETKEDFEYIKINNFKTSNFWDLKQEDVKSFRFMLIEIDEDKDNNQISIEKQIEMIWLIENLPVRKITFSGGKSLHILLETGVDNLEDYKNLSKDVYYILTNLFKLNIDKSCSNVERSSRLSGFWRKKSSGDYVYQGLIYYDIRNDIGNLVKWRDFILNKYIEKNEIEEMLEVIERNGKFHLREVDVKNLLNNHFKDKIVEYKGRRLVWNGEYYEDLTKDLVKDIFYKEIKNVLENYNFEICFNNQNIKGGIKGFWLGNEWKQVDEINNRFCYVLRNGVYNVLTNELKSFDKETNGVLTSKLDFNLDLETSLDDLENIIKEKVYFWWRNQISFDDFKNLMYLHITNVDYRKLKFILMISGCTNTGKSSFNNLLNDLTNGKVLIKSGIKQSNFMLSGVNEQTKILQYEDSQMKGGFHIIKQLIGNKYIGVENKGKNEKMIENNLFVKIISNLNKSSYPEFFNLESQYFSDKLWNVMFQGKINEKDKEDFLEIGGEDYLVKTYGDVIVSYFLRTSKDFIKSTRRFLRGNFGENLMNIYEKMLCIFLENYFYRNEVNKTSRKSVSLSRINKTFKMYLSKFGISFSEFGKNQFLDVLENLGKRFMYHYKYKGGKEKNTLSSTYIFEIKGSFLFNLEERHNLEMMIEEINKDECPIDLKTGEILIENDD